MPARLERELAEDLGRVELLQGQDLGRNGPEHGAGAAVLVEGVDPKRARPWISNEKSHSRFLRSACAAVVHDVVHHGVDLLVVQRIDVDAAHVAMHPDHRRQAGRQVQVGRLVLDLNASSWVMSMDDA
jgi:hypothetical protein